MGLGIYHVKGTRSMRVIWLCHELGLPLEIWPVDFSPEYRSTPEWRAISPTGKVPAMVDGDLTMFESGAMVQHILEKYDNGRMRPEPGTDEGALFQQWCWFAEATLARPLGDVVHHTRLKPEPERIPAVVVDAEQRARVCLSAVNDALADQEYLLGEFCAADIMMGYSLMLASSLGILDDKYPNAGQYFAQLQAMEGYRVASQ